MIEKHTPKLLKLWEIMLVETSLPYTTRCLVQLTHATILHLFHGNMWHINILIHYVRPSVCDSVVFYLSRRGRAAFSVPEQATRFGSAIRECCRGWGARQARATDWTEVEKLLPCERGSSVSAVCSL
jgi:hypothetical protein